MRQHLLKKWISVFTLVFITPFLSSSGDMNMEEYVIPNPYEYVLKDLRDYISVYYPGVGEVRIINKDYLPKRIKKGKQELKIRFVDLSAENDKTLNIDYVLEILPFEKKGENYQIGIICYKVDLTTHQVSLMQTSSLIYTFKKSGHGFLFKDATKPLPKDFK
jgi:hypothetical protein